MAKGLGRGFQTLIPTDFDSSLYLDSNERIQKLSVSVIVANPDQPRRHFDDNSLAELASSLKQFGVLQPLIVSVAEQGTYRIVAGERRWRAAQIAGITQVPAIVRAAKALEELEIALVENVQRVDLSPLEQAVSIERLHHQFSVEYKDIAKRLGKAETTVNNIVRLLQLPEPARQALQLGVISEGHARSILALKAMPERQIQLLKCIIDHGWSVRQAEQFVTSCKKGESAPKAVKQHMAAETLETKRLAKHLSVPVSIKRTAKGGRLELHFKSDEELADLIIKLG